MGFDSTRCWRATRVRTSSSTAGTSIPSWWKVLRSIGFDRFYLRAEGAIFRRRGPSLPRLPVRIRGLRPRPHHPAIKKALHEAIDADLPNLIQMDAALLPGVLASEMLKRCHPGWAGCSSRTPGPRQIESALKFSRHATGRPGWLFCEHGFHCLTARCAVGERRCRVPQWVSGRSFRFHPGPFATPDVLERELRSGDVASLRRRADPGHGVYVAPQGSTGTPSRELCRSVLRDPAHTGRGADPVSAVPAGSGPTSTTASSRHRDDVEGLFGWIHPIGAMGARRRSPTRSDSSISRALGPLSTFKNNQLAMVAALATLATIDDENLVDRAG